MPILRQLRLLALVATLVMVAASCGQKPGVSLSAGGVAAGDASSDLDLGPVPTEPGQEPLAPEEPGAPVPGPEAGAAPTTPGAGPGPTAGGTGTTAPKPAGPAPAGPAPAPAPATKQDRTGIDDAKKEIVIGIHAPVTGAAPIEQKTFENGREVYWQFVRDNGGILGGYNVRVVFRDDQFSPTVARQKCQEMVENEKVFLLIGGAGADQITSCARYAESVGVPYLSAGVNTEGLEGLKNYFAVSMTYAQQAPLLAGLIKNRIGKTNVGLAVLDTPDFVDARKAAVAAIGAAGGKVVADEKIPKTAGKNETDATAANLAKAGAEVVYVLTSPTIFLNFTKSIRTQVGYDPDLVGPGITNGLNLVATAGCPDVAKSQFLSPFPQLDVIDSLDPDYRRTYQAKVRNQQPDDIGIALWGINKVTRMMLEASAANGAELSRQKLLAGITSGREFKTNVFPPVRYSAADHFGARQAHLLRADCTALPPSFKTAAQFASGF